MAENMGSGVPGSATECILSGEQTAVPIILAWLVAVISLFMVLFHIYTAWFSQLEMHVQRHIFLGSALTLGILVYPLGRKHWSDRLNWFFIVDAILILASILPVIWITASFDRLFIDLPVRHSLDYTAGLATVIALLELTRRCAGWPLLIISLFFVAQNLFGPYFPGVLEAPPISWRELIWKLYMETYGIYGIPVDTATRYLVMFFILVGLLKATGASSIFLNFSSAITGRFVGGPAKIAVVASSLFGSMTGSPAANVSGTGSFTIPMMKEMGYKPHIAGAVEAAASTGGQFVPPVMGITAFLMSEFMGVSYLSICIAGLIPAFLYYLSTFMSVHNEAKKAGLKGLPRDKVPRLGPVLMDSWTVGIPFLVLFLLMKQGLPLGRCAMWTSVVLFFLAVLRPKTRLSVKNLLVSFEDAAKMAALIGAICGTAGIIIGVFYTSGIGDTLSRWIVEISAGNVYFALVLTGILCIVLGMGVPTYVIYVMMLLITIPALIAMGVEKTAAHFFTFYMGVSSGITPPVCITAYVAATLAGGKMMRTGFAAMRLGIVVYLVPFLFYADPGVLMIGSPLGIITTLVRVSIGIAALTSGLDGWLLRRATWGERILFIVGGLALCVPVWSISLGGATLTLLAVALQWRPKQKEIKVEPTF
ncbi:TRAP transporter permease [Thermodesulfobacteriota bacterium]